ncbi:hypothetical protein [Bacillus cereus]|uniref:hypothetical protein n=1 Tax=Bacillus TaxID=1386 RepID=UPI000BF93034|nr:hypothetical protein [Bacillus cereus]PFK48655.1 hypothetical protein COJ14_25500 [Bacillus cereus]
MESMKEAMIREYLRKDLEILLDEGIIAESDKRIKSFIFVGNNSKHQALADIIKEILKKERYNYDIENQSDDDEEGPYRIFTLHTPNKNGDWVRCIYTTEIIDPAEVVKLMSNRI